MFPELVDCSCTSELPCGVGSLSQQSEPFSTVRAGHQHAVVACAAAGTGEGLGKAHGTTAPR
eukprot:2989972-Amphidinium_carterae.1